jgi:hypothetical protein
MPDDPSSALPPAQEPLPALPVGDGDAPRESRLHREDEAPRADEPPREGEALAEPSHAPAPDEQPLPPVGFWQQPFVQNVVPVLGSLAVHLGVILLAVLTYQVYRQTHTVTQEQVIVPDAAIVQGDVGGIPNPGLGGDPTRASASELVPENSRSDAWNKQPSKSLQSAILGGKGETQADTVIGVGTAQSLGKGSGLGAGSGQADAGAAPFGVPGGGAGLSPAVKFIGVSGNAKTVCYVCDASGSMMGLPFDLLKIELHKAVDVLMPIQAFDIILFQKGIAVPFSRTLTVANGVNKSRAFKWLNEQTVGSNSDPIPALRETFGQKPQLMYLLTDGAFDDNNAVVAELRRLNQDKQTRINTIAFFSADPDDSNAADRKACEDVLRLIAKENGGQFKIVYTSELTKQ